MRLIDADALKELYEPYDGGGFDENSKVPIGAIIANIDDMPTASPWVSVDDRLPGCGEPVLAIASGKPNKYVTLRNAYVLAEYSEEGWILEMWPLWEWALVNYWAPLPEPPEGRRRTMQCNICPIYCTGGAQSESCGIFGYGWDSRFMYRRDGKIAGCYVEKAYIRKIQNQLYGKGKKTKKLPPMNGGAKGDGLNLNAGGERPEGL